MTTPICVDCGNFIPGKTYKSLSYSAYPQLLCKACHNIELEMVKE